MAKSGVERLRAFKAKNGGSAAYRNRQRDASPEGRQKYLARKAVEYAVKTGRLERQPCERCGAEKAQAHHEDYGKPLDVMWLCPKDHKARHREIRQKPSCVAIAPA